MSKIVDIDGFKFGRLRVVGFVGVINRKAFWKCVCKCGVRKIVSGLNLRTGVTRSCGCIHTEMISNLNRSHGACSNKKTRGVFSEYIIWCGMKSRCFNAKNKRFTDYGGRGIRVCNRWIHSFPNFLADMGKKPTKKHTLERKNNNGNYTPRNCRWATIREQQHNRRDNRILTHNGKSLCMEVWAGMLGCKGGTIFQRLKRGWTVSDAVSVHVGGKRLL